MGNTKENPSIPGKAPARADHELSETELDRRNRRRARNREAATRQRQKREARVQMLEAEIEKLKSDRGDLSKQNIKLLINKYLQLNKNIKMDRIQLSCQSMPQNNQHKQQLSESRRDQWKN